MVLIVGSDHALRSASEVDADDLRQLKYVSLWKSSTLQGIASTLDEHGVSWKALQVVMVGSLPVHCVSST